VVKVAGRSWKVHRYAWCLVEGREPRTGAPIVQTCGHSTCCRPDHLVERAAGRRHRKARRPSGAGSVAEVRPGVWELRVAVGRNPKTGLYDRVTRTFEGSSTGAQRALAELSSEATAGTVKVGSETLDAVFDAWLAHLQRIGCSPNYIIGARRKINRNLRPTMGNKLARKVTVTFLDDVLAGLGSVDRPGGPLGPATIKQHKQLLSSVFTYGWKRDIVPTNPVLKCLSRYAALMLDSGGGLGVVEEAA
jgi:hypothetical protein